MQDRRMTDEPADRGPMPRQVELMTPRLELAFRWAAVCHDGQVRKGSDAPYFEHVAAVGLILDHAGFDEDVVITGLLHDVVEDTVKTVAEVEARFGPVVADLVAHCSEVKTDDRGNKRPWIDRKRDHLAAMAVAPLGARAVMLADKLHNLVSIELDLHEGRPVWSQFNAGRDQVLWYYTTAIEACGRDDSRLATIASACHDALERVDRLG